MGGQWLPIDPPSAGSCFRMGQRKYYKPKRLQARGSWIQGTEPISPRRRQQDGQETGQDHSTSGDEAAKYYDDFDILFYFMLLGKGQQG
jgi:hypothetical protein